MPSTRMSMGRGTLNCRSGTAVVTSAGLSMATGLVNESAPKLVMYVLPCASTSTPVGDKTLSTAGWVAGRAKHRSLGGAFVLPFQEMFDPGAARAQIVIEEPAALPDPADSGDPDDGDAPNTVVYKGVQLNIGPAKERAACHYTHDIGRLTHTPTPMHRRLGG